MSLYRKEFTNARPVEFVNVTRDLSSACQQRESECERERENCESMDADWTAVWRSCAVIVVACSGSAS